MSSEKKQYKKFSVDEFVDHHNKWLEYVKTNPNASPFMKSSIEFGKMKEHKSPNGITIYLDTYVVTDFVKGIYELFDISFQGILTSSGAKLPPNQTLEKANHMQVKFSDINEEFLKGTSVKAESYPKVIAACNSFLDALDVFDTESKPIHKRLMGNIEYRAKLNIAENQSPALNNIKQESRKPTDLEKKSGQYARVQLECPMYTVRLNADRKTRRFLYEGEKFSTPTILNMRERTKEGIFPEYLLNGNSLDMNNVHQVVRFKSIVAGIMRPTSNFSGQGLTVCLEFNKLIIYPGPISAQGTDLANRISDLTGDFDLPAVDEPDNVQTPQVTNMPVTQSMTDSGEPDTNLMNIVDEKVQTPLQKNQSMPVAPVVASVQMPVVAPSVAPVVAAPRQQRNTKFGK